MGIEHKDIKVFKEDDLKSLFLSVGWESGKYPNELLEALKGSHSVITAWNGNNLIGLLNALSDGFMTVYFHYMLVKPEYQGKEIGKEMMGIMLKKYDTYKNKLLISYPETVKFYEKCGFKGEEELKPMFITEML